MASKNSVIKEHIRALTPYLPPLDGRDPEKFTLLDFNERTIPVPAHVTDALKSWVDQGSLQKYPNYGHMQEQIAKYAGVKKEQCMFTNGSDQGIELVIRCCCEKGTEAIIPSPTFAMYEQASESEALTIKRPKFTREGGFPLDEVLGLIGPKTSIVIVSNPNNPTGTPVKRDAILKILEKAQCAVLVDECYFEFMGSADSMKDDIDAFPNLFICRTFSKTWGFPSLRLGYVLTAKENISALTCVRGPYDVNHVAGVALNAALQDNQYVWDFVKEVNEKSKPMFEAYMKDKGIVFWPSTANFIFCYFDKPLELEKEIRKRGILVRPKKDAEGVSGLRVTIGTVEQMKSLMKVLDELLPGEPPAKRQCLGA